MTSKQSNTSGGVGFLGLLTVAFIVLKLTDNIDWSWWWVLSPIWIPSIIVLLIVIIVIIFGLSIKAFNNE